MSHKSALLTLVALQGLYFGPVLAGHVIYPHDNAAEVGVDPTRDKRLNSRKFADNSDAFIPEINFQLNGKSRGWLATWNPHVELGRPASQLAGKSYLLTHGLSLVTCDPFRLYTAHAVLTVILTALFCYAFLQALGLCPAACLCGAAGLSTGVNTSYWLTFVMFLTPACWTVCLLWLITRFLQRPSSVKALGVSFAVYSLFITGYPQAIVLDSYLMAGFTMLQLSQVNGPASRKITIAGLLLLAALSGAIMAAPAYIDLAVLAGRSGRVGVDPDFFLRVLPRIDGIKDLFAFLGSVFDGFWFGNPIAHEQALKYGFNGLSLTPVFCILALLSTCLGQWRRLLFWQAFGAVCLLGTLSPSVYLFAVKYLGFHLSRCQLLGGAMLPGYVIASYTVDHVMRRGLTWRPAIMVLAIAPVVVNVVTSKTNSGAEIKIIYVALSCFLVGATLLVVYLRSNLLLQSLVVVSMIMYSQRLMLTRPLHEIKTCSPLVQRIRAETSDGSRLAIFGAEFGHLLPPNQEALFGLHSIHSYDSLSSKNYQRLTSLISDGGTFANGRHFNYLDSRSRLESAALNYCGIGMIATRGSLDSPSFQSVDECQGIQLYRPIAPPILQVRLVDYKRADDGVVIDAPLPRQKQAEVQVVDSFDDWKRFCFPPSASETLLFVSQQYHPQWHAASGSQPLQTLPVNDFFLGIIVPPNVTDLVIQFRPYVRFSWIAQVFYMASALVCLGKPLKSRVFGPMSLP